MVAPNAGPNKRAEGPQGNRVRNTSTSNQARGAPSGPPSVPGLGESFGSAAGITSGLAGAWAALQNTLGAMRSQRVGLRAAFKTERANIRMGAIGQMSDAINAGIESGMTGSSNTSQARVGVLGQRRADIEAAKSTMTEGVLQTKVAEQQAIGQYSIAENTAMMQAAAMRQQQAIADAALAAQEQGQADMLAFMERGLEPQKVSILGREVTTLPSGVMEVGGMKFAAGTDIAVIAAALRERHLNSTPGPGDTGPTYNQIAAMKG